MGNYQICDCCGNLFEKTNHPMCRHCLEGYQKIRGIVEEFPHLTVMEISSRTGITVSKIYSYVNKGYFIINEGTIEEGNK